jgi:hypothetical protein
MNKNYNPTQLPQNNTLNRKILDLRNIPLYN